MAYKPSPAKQPVALLKEAKPLRGILHQAERVSHLQRLFDSVIQPAAREHWKVASYREGVLLLVITDGQWATRMRYQQKRLQRDLQRLEVFYSLRTIHFKVQPSYTTETKKRVITLSESAGASIQAAAEGISDPRLKAALERLASHANTQEKPQA